MSASKTKSSLKFNSLNHTPVIVEEEWNIRSDQLTNRKNKKTDVGIVTEFIAAEREDEGQFKEKKKETV